MADSCAGLATRESVIRTRSNPQTHMLKEIEEERAEMELNYPGIHNQVRHLEAIRLPRCRYCKSNNTALVQCGVIGRTIEIASATTKFRLRASGIAAERVPDREQF